MARDSKGASGSRSNNRPTARRVIDARNDEQGNVNQVLIEGNQNYTSTSRAIPMAERGELENVHVVHPKDGNPYLRTNPDGRTGNNLDEMAKDS
jgi:hypothetical protein